VLSWGSGVLLQHAAQAGGLTTSDTPSAAEVIKGLELLHGDTLNGWSPPLTFTAGQPHSVDCWFTLQVKNGNASLIDGGKTTCESSTSS
jgi:branched-chain amino acid transport system substrate-binding protein